MKILPFALFALSLPAAIHATSDEDCETEERLCVSSQIFLIDGEDAVPYPNSTIAIVDSRTTNVTFSITQGFLETNVDYIYPVFDSDGRDMVCAEENAMVDVALGYTQTFTAECDQWGKASIELFVRDSSFTGASPETNYRNCPNFSGARVATYKLQLSCDGTPVCGPDYEAEIIAEEEAAEEADSGYKCMLPANTKRYSVITRGDAEISASNLYKAVAIGGTMSNPVGNKMVIGSEHANMSYMYRLIGKCLMDFKGYRQIGAYLRKVIDFEHFEYIARNAESRKIKMKNIIVMTRGGIFDIRDFCTVCIGGSAETGNRLLIIFNTDEKVVLKGSADGLPFLASVVAPFSRVEVDGSAGYVDGVIVADTFATVGDNASSLELRGRHMERDLYCGPTEAPTWAPTAYTPETYENICLTGQILLTNDEDVKPLPDKVIAVEKAEETTVTFSITNQWNKKLHWIVPVFDEGGTTMVCADANRMVNPNNGESSTFKAECTNGKAKVDVFVRDSSFRETTQENVYNCPTWWGDAHYKGVYSFELSCTDEEICSDYTTDPVTEPDPEPLPLPDNCKMPMFTGNYAIITKSHAEISMHEIERGLAIGGLLSNPLNTTVVVGTKRNRPSFIDRVVDECHIEFKGGRRIGKPLEEVLDFGFFEHVARTAFNRTQSNKRKVIVMTHGGTFNTQDFIPGFKPQWTDGRKTVVVFNTEEKVILTSTADGQPFRPTVIAPFSRVELHSDAGYMEGSIVAHSFATTGSNPSALSMKGLAYDGRFCDSPSERPAGTIVTTIEGDEDNVCEMCKARGHGDPHIITFDGVRYDVHVKGELTFLKSLDSGFEIQARTEPAGRHGKYMVTTGMVVKDDNLPKIQVSFATQNVEKAEKVVAMGGCPVQLFVDDVPRYITTGSGTPDATVQTAGNRIVIEYPSTKLQLEMLVRSGKNKCVFNIDYLLGDCRCGETLVGILGNPNGERNDDWMEEDGTPVEIPEDGSERRFEKAYNYSKTWCVTEDASNFAYNEGTDFETFDGCTDEYDEEMEDVVEEASEECKEKCIINGELDPGCLIDCDALGTEAGDEYLEIEETPTDDPTAAPITSEPTAAPTPVASGDPTAAPVTSDPTAAPTSPLGATSGNNTYNEPPPEGDTPVPPSGSLGDPHFRTWTNEHFEYHGQCDLMLATDMHFADGLGLDVQIRTKLVRFWSYIKTAAIRIGDDIFEFQGDAFPEESSGPKYWFNLEYHGKLDTIGGFPISMIRNSPLKTMFEIDLDSMYPGQKIIIGAYKEFVRVDFRNGSEESYGNVAGLLGNFKTGETLSRDGAKVIDNFTELGQEWQLRPTDNMLFHDISDPQFPKQCIEPEDPQGERRRRLEESSLSEGDAEAACASVKDPIDRKNCIYDILATQDVDMVGAY